jgi:hypothetical protein
LQRTSRGLRSRENGRFMPSCPRLAVVYFTFIVILGFVLNEEGRAKVKDIGALKGALERCLPLFRGEHDVDARTVRACSTGVSRVCFVNWHMHFTVPARFLRPHEVRKILDGLTAEEKRRLGYRSWPIRRIWLSRLRRSGAFAFALVWKAASGTHGVVRFRKSAHELEISYELDAPLVALYTQLASAIPFRSRQGRARLRASYAGGGGP